LLRKTAALSLFPEQSALEHERAPRPLPLFLDLVRQVAERDPEVARAALDGLAAYERAERGPQPPPKPEVARVRSASLRDHGGEGAAAILIPSLINPPRILDLDAEVSLAAAVARMGRRALLLDWGDARDRAALSVGEHVEHLLLPLLREVGEPAALVGYCLGGTMAIAAANLAPCEQVVTLAAPWHFSRYPEPARTSLAALWRRAEAPATALGALPMEVLQAAFWSLDPTRTVAKFARFSGLDPASDDARRFVQLEDWANAGEPLPLAAARELIEDFFSADLPGTGQWRVGRKAVSDQLTVPLVNLTAAEDRIAPPETAAAGAAIDVPAGHVGMVIGSARGALQDALARALAPACR
jgi:polyhydroxyalkanoate synthase